MAKQDGRRPLEVQPKPPSPISPRARTYHRGLQNSIESFGAASQRGKDVAVFVSAQRAWKPVKVRGAEERFFKAPFGHP